MSKFQEDTIAVIDIHGDLYCANCYNDVHFHDEVREIKRANLAKMAGPEAGHHTEECDECGRVWGIREGVTSPRWIYEHQLKPITEADIKKHECFFMDGGVNGEWFIIPYKHRAEWFEWINSQDVVANGQQDPPDYCTHVELSEVIFHKYEIDSEN